MEMITLFKYYQAVIEMYKTCKPFSKIPKSKINHQKETTKKQAWLLF